MTFGFIAHNEAGALQLHGGFFTPEFIGKIVLSEAYVVSYDGGEFQYEVRAYAGPGLDFGGRDVMIFWAVPENVQWLMPLTFLYAAATNTDVGMFAFCDPATVIVGGPIGYVFALGPVTPSDVQFGFRAWNEFGQLTFDSGRPHLAIHQAPIVPTFEKGVTKSVPLDRALPAQPAFLMPYVISEIEDYPGYLNDGGTGQAYYQQWWGSLQWSGQSVQTRFPKVYDTVRPATDQSSRTGYYIDTGFGNTSGLAMPIIDCSIYNGLP